MPTDLPYLDTHTITVALGAEQVWERLRRYVETLGIGERNPVGLVLGTQPRSGFAIAQEVPPERIVLEGRHRFSRYRLVFEVEARTADRTTLLHAHSYAEFPGVPGTFYRALVIGTGLHVVATNRLLRDIVRR